MQHNPQPPLILQEYGSSTTLNVASSHFSLTSDTFLRLFRSTINNTRGLFPKLDFVEYLAGNAFRFTDIAGILNISPLQRIEIIPKFLNPSNNNWREDFLRIATITGHGQLFHHTLIPSARQNNLDLFELIASTWIGLFEASSRDLPRAYVNTRWEAFQLDGDIDEEDILLPEPDGFSQTGLLLSRANNLTQKLFRAASYLRPRVKAPANVLHLDRALSTLSQSLREPHSRHHKPFDSARASRWQPVLELSDIILSQNSLGFSGSGSSFLPGYLIRTAPSWETLVSIGMKKAFPELTISKTPFVFARRVDHSGRSRSLHVTPDVTLSKNNSKILLADAKYKVASDSGDRQTSCTISAQDVYESLAFLNATKCETIILFYPNKRSLSDNPTVGQPVETVYHEQKRILAVSLGVAGISRPKGLDMFAENIRNVTNTCLST